MEISNKVALITGGASGLGLALPQKHYLMQVLRSCF